MASVTSSSKLSSNASSSTRDSGTSSCSNNNVNEKVSEDDTLLDTPYSPVPVVRSHHQLVQSPYSCRRHHRHHNNCYSTSYTHNRHYHLNGDTFDDSSSSLSSTPSSGCTTATATSSTSSTVSDCAIDCIRDSLTSQLENQSQTSRSSKNASSSSASSSYLTRSGHRSSVGGKNIISEQTLNDLNCSPSSNHSKSSRKSCKVHCNQVERETGDRNRSTGRSSTPPALANTENWSHFHFANTSDHHGAGSVDCDDSHRNSSSRASSEVYSMSATLDQRLKSVTLNSSPKMSSSGKAVAVIKATASVSRLSSSSFNNGSLSTSNNTSGQDWKKHLHSHEIRKLKRELDQSNEKVATLTSQLATHSHMVTAFEQSLASMSLRLQQLTNLSSQKDCEILRLKSKVDELRSSQSRNETITSTSSGSKKSREKRDSKSNNKNLSINCSSNVKQLSEKEKKSLLIRRHTFVSPIVNDIERKEVTNSSKEGRWFKAFRRSNSSNKKCIYSTDSISDHETIDDTINVLSHGCRVASVESFAQIDTNHDTDSMLVHELKKQLREKEKTITDLRLEALTTAHQLQSLEELLSQLKSEISMYKSENERLNKLSTGSGASSMTSIKISGQSSPCKVNEPSSNNTSSEWKNSNEASGYASINSLFFNPYDSC